MLFIEASSLDAPPSLVLWGARVTVGKIAVSRSGNRWSTIQVLFSLGCPTNVTRLVVALWVRKTIEGVTGPRSMAHIHTKSNEVVNPRLVNRNSTGSITKVIL
jgi:hypothetical protein